MREWIAIGCAIYFEIFLAPILLSGIFIGYKFRSHLWEPGLFFLGLSVWNFQFVHQAGHSHTLGLVWTTLLMLMGCGILCVKRPPKLVVKDPSRFWYLMSMMFRAGLMIFLSAYVFIALGCAQFNEPPLKFGSRFLEVVSSGED